MTPQIEPGCHVVMHYSLALPDETETEIVSTFGDAPITFTLGDGTLDPGLELTLYGLRAGDQQRLTMMPGQAFGNRNAALIQSLPRGSFPNDVPPSEGELFTFTTAEGEETAGIILETGSETVKVDFNHPLAERPFIFRVEILSVIPAAS